MAKKAFVTGATGFIGVNIVKQLTERGWEVTAIHRPNSDLSYLNRFPVKLTLGDITDIDSLRRAMPEQPDAVFHLAGDTNYWSRRNARQTAIQVDGTRHVATVAVEKGARCLIHTSSVAAWGEVSGHIDEDLPLQGQHSWIHYNKTKWMGEQEVLKGMEKGMKVVILNPATVIGPYDASSWGNAFISVKNDAFPFALPGCASFAHATEVAKAHIEAVEKGRNGHRYILGGEPGTTYADFFREVAGILGKEKAPKPAPAWLLKTIGYVMVAVAAITGKEPLITPEFATVTSRKNRSYSSEKAIRELDYRIVPLKQCVADCYHWLVAEGLL
ncbi:MAG: NAD-dependent epimerase/dehydratase family protein [Saprospirales bacterium]|nr:NAD-dependent epimerase/dehydratase family protein [Saprospirales bacterium]MBK6901615.1 NAD-dependent epimerase/dehydratase family protein [Saprospirales bacterium]